LERNETKTNTELSALTYLETNLNAFQTYVTDLSSPDVFQSRQAVSSSDAVSVNITGKPVSANYLIESRQLAQSHTLVSNHAFSSASDTLTNGTLTITAGGQSSDIVIDASNNTLEGLQKLINNGDYGVNAAIINNGGNYQMMFSSKDSGAANAVSISGISEFDTLGLTTTSEAQDSVMVLNGLAITSSTNSFEGVVEGVTFQLNSATPGSNTQVSVDRDPQTVIDTINSFADVYNQLDVILSELGSYESLTAEQELQDENAYFGDLAGSSILRQVSTQLRGAMSGAIAELDGAFNNLAAVGISFDREGVLNVDQTQLQGVANTDLDALSALFSKDGIASDNMVNVLESSDRTLAGTYALDITQLAEKANVSGLAPTFALNEYRLSGDLVADQSAVLEVQSGAQFDLNLNGTTQTVVLNAASYADKNTIASDIETQINTLFGASSVSVAYDTVQSRFELTTANGTLAANNFTNMEAQGFSTRDYTSEQLIDLSVASGSFDVVINGSTSAVANLNADKYTLSELSDSIESSINSLSEVKAASAGVTVSSSGGVLNISSTRFGGSSEVTLSNFTNLAAAGLSTDLTDAGSSVDGTITTATGVLNLGAYADPEDGRVIKISNYAVIGSEPAEVRGLEFEVIGGLTGSRGNVSLIDGFASRLQGTVDDLLDNEEGVITQRMESLNLKLDDYDERNDDIDLRYDKLLLKYQLQFSLMQSILSSSQQTRDFLTATYSNNSN
ncbi:MAG: flagellar filament capping protein FliD, partial [Pseudomonadota bacterium]|nr:flagellar filament capping protein FliD [Pseudomonadota bacterium]